MIVGIAGGTCTGKSLIASIIEKYIGLSKTSLVHFDDYSKGQKNILSKNNDFDCPSAFRMNQFAKDIRSLKNGKDVKMISYSADVNNPEYTTKVIKVKEIIIVEGFLIFHDENILNLYDKKFYIDISEKTMISRRLKRSDGFQRWDTKSYILGSLLESYREFVVPQKNKCDQILDGNKKPTDLARIIVNSLSDGRG